MPIESTFFLKKLARNAYRANIFSWKWDKFTYKKVAQLVSNTDFEKHRHSWLNLSLFNFVKSIGIPGLGPALVGILTKKSYTGMPMLLKKIDWNAY